MSLQNIWSSLANNTEPHPNTTPHLPQSTLKTLLPLNLETYPTIGRLLRSIPSPCQLKLVSVRPWIYLRTFKKLFLFSLGPYMPGVKHSHEGLPPSHGYFPSHCSPIFQTKSHSFKAEDILHCVHMLTSRSMEMAHGHCSLPQQWSRVWNWTQDLLNKPQAPVRDFTPQGKGHDRHHYGLEVSQSPLPYKYLPLPNCLSVFHLHSFFFFLILFLNFTKLY